MENTVENEWKPFSEGEGYVSSFFYPNRSLLKVLDLKHECLHVLYGAPEAGHGIGDSSDHGLLISTDNPLRAFLSGCFWICAILFILSWTDIWFMDFKVLTQETEEKTDP